MVKSLIKSLPDFQQWWLRNKRPAMAFDTETSSLDYKTLELVGFSLCNGEEACYVNFVRPEGSRALLPYSFAQWLNQIDLWIMHNSVFDLKVLYKYDLKPNQVFCTLTGAKLVNENMDSYALKYLAHKVLKVPESKILTYEQAESFGQDSPKFADYAMNDAVWAYQLYELLKSQLKSQDLEHLAYNIEFPFQFVLRDLEINGIKADRKWLNSANPKLDNMIYETECELLASIGMNHIIDTTLNGDIYPLSPINLNSTQQLAPIIKGLGFKVNKTKKGNDSIDSAYLKSMIGKHPLFELLYKHGKLSDMKSKFVGKLPNFMDSDDRVRASYQMVRTGRLSVSKPPLQQQPNPKKEKLYFNYREAFIPEPGNVLVCADWSGQELRVLAEVSQDERMKDAFKNNLDLHLLTAKAIFDLPIAIEDIKTTSPSYEQTVLQYKMERHKGKNKFNFPIIYGMTEFTLAKDLGITREKARELMDKFFELYPGVKKAIRVTEIELDKQQYVTTLMGRRRRFPQWKNANKWEKERILRQAFNFKIQGFSADMAKTAAVKISKILSKYDSKVILMVHDEWVFECPKSKVKEFAEEIKHIMEHCVVLSLPIIVDISIKSNYGG